MQIFVKHPADNRTLVCDCSPEMTISEFVEWVYDRTMWPLHAYYITHRGRPVPTIEADKSFKELGIEKEDTLNLIGRFFKSS